MNILIVKLSAMGDVIHTLPSLAALRKHCPEADITWVVEEDSSDLLEGHPLLDRVLVSRRKSWFRDLRSPFNAIGALKEMNSFLKSLRDRCYDLVIDFHGLFKSSIIVLLSGGKRKLGYDSLQELSGLFLNERIPEDLNKHAVERYLDFVRHLGCPVDAPQFPVFIAPGNEDRITELLGAAGIGREESFVAMNPVALWDTKLWSENKFAELSDLIRGAGIPVVFTGKDNSGLIEAIRSRSKSATVSLAGKTSLKDLAALYRRAALLVTTDSGPMHLAAAVGTPVVALFGPTSPVRTGPYGNGHIVIRRETACSPCFKKECATRECLLRISVEEVWDAVQKILRKKSRN